MANAQHRVADLERALQRIAAIPGVIEVRHRGLMIGIALASRPDRALGVEVCHRARHHGVILRPLGDVVVWMPPLSIRAEEVELLETATMRAIHDVAR
jgi:adenosylmethionine-8-amino-7-oxononanoate aminotransferase